MKPKTIVLMIVAIVCGLAASYLTSRVIAEHNRDSDQPEDDKVTILVAKQKILMGTLIKDPRKYFQEKQYTKGQEPKKAIKTWAEVQDKRLFKPLDEDQFVTADNLMDPKMTSIEALLPPGMRAVALKVNAASVVAGFVMPNSRVDVVLTMRHGEDSSTQTILQNMLVLASDTMLNRPEDKQANLGSTVTVAAKPEDAHKLRLAEAIGELSLSLRGGEDNEIVAIKETRRKDLGRTNNSDGGPDDGSNGGGGGSGGGVSQVPDAPAPGPGPAVAIKPDEPPPAPPKTVTQIIWNGESLTKTVFVLTAGEVSTQVEKTGPEREPRPEKKESPTKGESEPKSKADKGQPEPKTKKDADPAKPEGVK